MGTGTRTKKPRKPSSDANVAITLLILFGVLLVFTGVTIPILFSSMSDSDAEIATLKTMITALSHNTTVIQNLDLVALEAALHPVPVHTIYVNDATGDDSNTGTTAGSPLKTIPAAILKFNKMSAVECVVLLADGGYYLGEDPVFDFSITVERCQKLVIRGPRQNVVTDTVASLATVGPNFQDVTGTTGGYTAGLYEKAFVENLNKSNIYAIRGNTAGVVQSIAGIVSYYDIPPVEVNYEMWTVGDSYTLFTVSANITWAGQFSFIIPESQEFLWMENLLLAPDSTGQFLGPDHHSTFVRFRGCVLHATEAGLSIWGAWSGSIFLEGVYIKDEGGFAFNQPQEATGIYVVSVYSDILILTNNYGYFHFLYGTGTGYSISNYGGILRVFGLWSPDGGGIEVDGCNDARIDTVYVPTSTSMVFSFYNAIVYMRNIQVIGDPFSVCIDAKSAWVTAVSVECDTDVAIIAYSSEISIGGFSVDAPAMGVGHHVRALQGSAVRLSGNLAISGLGTGAAIFIDSGSSVVVTDATPSINTAAVGIEMRNGATLTTNAPINNAGAGSDVDFCGAGIIAFPASNTNDLGAGTPENCFINVY